MEYPIAKNKICAATLKLLGDYWTLRIIDALEPGPLRFCELQRNVDNLNPATLSGRLKKLEQANLLSRHEDQADKGAVSYFLSPLGRESLPVLEALDSFSSKAKRAFASS
jgi:DNA-binding HxlR family transcriptional regulator